MSEPCSSSGASPQAVRRQFAGSWQTPLSAIHTKLMSSSSNLLQWRFLQVCKPAWTAGTAFKADDTSHVAQPL